MNRQNALTGTLVADAAALGLHWMYDQQHIACVEATGSVLFRQPDANTYVDVKAFFAQGGRVAGQLSHYGESARLVGELCKAGSYSTAEHRNAFMKAFGPCGTFTGYADRPTKALVLRILSDVDKVVDPSGIDDDQLPGLCPVAGIFAHGLSKDTALSAVQVISTHTDVLDGADILYSCLERLLQGIPLQDALMQTASQDKGALYDLLLEALSMKTYQPLEAATQFGLACHVPQGLPLVWHLLNHADNFEAAVRDNIRCGGDSCGRAMVLGALAGLAFDIPATLHDRMASL